eukprot:Polyplicarium_translucidae@DN1605_c0_g1_i2.p1
MATLNYPCWGYGIRYTYGIFEQKLLNGRQVEFPDYWLVQDNPWEIARNDIAYAVRFFGEVREYHDADLNKRRLKWVGGEIVQAMAYDNPIPGFDTYNTINLRLWKAAPSKEFDFYSFNEGEYLTAIHDRQRAEAISAVLYPNDNTLRGKELRLKQQYFFVCATLQDVLRRFKKKAGRKWEDLPKKVAMQLNDTHPAIVVPELMRILMDFETLEWDAAWAITREVFNYTNHTVLPEALERWPADLIGRLLPRHLLIINEINHKFLEDVRQMWGEDWDKISNMSIYQEGEIKMIRMANLAVVGSKHVNGVAAIHTGIVKNDLFKNFHDYYTAKGQKNKFLNVTNGVTPRRWIHCANRQLSTLISEWLGSDAWLKELHMAEGLSNHADDPVMHDDWMDVKKQNKARLAKWIEYNCGVHVDHETMLFDVQVKRIHEYKRQLMNCFYIIHRYLWLKSMSPEERKETQPRACLIGGKAAPGYATAKSIIKFCSSIGAVINGDVDVSPFLKVVFLPNYNVSSAQIIIPASDLSQHISTAGMEASGTSNMKFVMNGGLIVGTLDGANVEIREECGEDTFFLFGAREDQVKGLRAELAEGNVRMDDRLKEVFQWIRGGHLARGDAIAQAEFEGLANRVCNNGGGHVGDFYLIIHDFPDYCRAQEEADAAYKNQAKWARLSILAASRMGKFTTDRTIREYAKNIWDIEPAEKPSPDYDKLERTRSFANDPMTQKTGQAKKEAVPAVKKPMQSQVAQPQAHAAAQPKPKPAPTAAHTSPPEFSSPRADETPGSTPGTAAAKAAAKPPQGKN